MPRISRAWSRYRAPLGFISLTLFTLTLFTIATLALYTGFTERSHAAPAAVTTANEEFIGKLEPELVANDRDMEKIVFSPVANLDKVQFQTALPAGAHVTGRQITVPPQEKPSLLAILVEPSDDGSITPFLYADYNKDRKLTDDERVTFTPAEKGTSKKGGEKKAEGEDAENDGAAAENEETYIFKATLRVPTANAPFANYPLVLNYFRRVMMEDMKEGDRLVLQSSEAFAQGYVDIKGRRTLVYYGYNPDGKKISQSKGWLGVDGDADGKILMDRLSPEAAVAQDETIIFRAGDAYVSTKRVDAQKREIVMRAHNASEYKRVEMRVGSELPDFPFTDFNGKKRKFSEFRGKYVLIDFWGTWCGPCLRELPYLKAAYQRFNARNFEIIGMNDDEDTQMVKPWLKRNGLTWTQATQSSITDFRRSLRVHIFPTTILINPEGKIISLNQRGTDQPDLRGEDLLESLDKILPQ